MADSIDDMSGRDTTALMLLLAAVMGGGYTLSSSSIQDTVRKVFDAADAFEKERTARNGVDTIG